MGRGVSDANSGTRASSLRDVVAEPTNSFIRAAAAKFREGMMKPKCDECRAIAEELRKATTGAWPAQLAAFKEMLGPAGDDLPVVDTSPDPNAVSRAHSAFRKLLLHQVATGHTVPFPKR